MGISEITEIERLSSSSSFLRLADSILLNLDRETLAEFLAAYFYLKSNGKTNIDIAGFIITRKFAKGATIAIDVAAAAIPGLIFDEAFRSVILNAVTNTVRRKGHSKR